MQAVFSTVEKRANSTKQGTGGASYTVTLKEGCSIIAPRLALIWPGSGNPCAYNQCYISDFGRYYWVEDWTYVDRQWVASCRVDVLATMKDEIGNSTRLVARSAFDFDNGVSDSIHATKMDPVTFNTNLTGLAFAHQLNYGLYVVGIIGQGNTFNAAGSGYVIVTGTELQQMIDACFTENDNTWSASSLGGTVGEVFANYGKNFMKSIQNPAQFITSIVWIPLPSLNTQTGFAPVHIGPANTNVYGATFTNPVATVSFSTGTVLPTPITVNSGKWRLMEPFTRYTLVCPPFGSFPLDGARVVEKSGIINGIIKIDCLTGQAVLQLDDFGICSAAQLGIPMKLSGAMTDYAGMTSAALSTVSAASSSIGRIAGGVLSGGLGGGIASGISAIADVGNGVINTLSAAQPTATQGSIGGGLAACNANRYVQTIFYDATDEDIPDMGRPLMQLKQLSTLPGFIQCVDGEIEGPYTREELDECNAFLVGGFFYE